MDVNDHLFVLSQRRGCDHGFAYWSSSGPDILECGRKGRRYRDVVFRNSRSILYWLLGHARQCSNGVRIRSRRSIPSLSVRDTSIALPVVSRKRLICASVFRFWSNVNDLTGTPVNAVWLVVTFCSCLNLIGIGSTQTIVAIFNITAPALDLSYIAVIIAHRVYEHRVPFIEGPYTLGRWSKPVNAMAIGWVVFISVVLFFPPTKPVTATNMNYAIAVAGLIALISLSWWFLSAKK